MDNQAELKKNLEAAELLLADVRNRRADLDRRERDLAELVAEYRAKLGFSAPALPREPLQQRGNDVTEVDEVFDLDEDEPQGPEEDDEYGAIGQSTIEIFMASNRKMNVPQLAKALEDKKIPIRAKSYYSAARTVVRRLYSQKKLRRVGTGYYKLDKGAEAQQQLGLR